MDLLKAREAQEKLIKMALSINELSRIQLEKGGRPTPKRSEPDKDASLSEKLIYYGINSDNIFGDTTVENEQ